MRLAIIFLFLHQFLMAQVIPAERRTDWSLAGHSDTIPVYNNIVDITAYGGVGDGVTANDTAFQNALSAIGGSGTMYFPAGDYFFTKSISLRDSIVIKGASADSTVLKFDLGGQNNLIDIAGTISDSTADFISPAYKDSSFIVVDNALLFQAGDYIKISQNDSVLMFSNWAYRSLGQIVRVVSVDGSRLNLASPLRKDYALSDSCRVTKIRPVRNAGIECLKILRLDTSVGQTYNIHFNYAVECWMRGVESEMTNFAHVAASNSSNIEITGGYFHDAFAYGGGGQGYGVLLQFTSGECLIENNIFHHLRHAMILQAGANGNVFAYNSSTDPFWDGNSIPLPANSAGDMVLHGNYVYMNLFEGNEGQNIVIDDSHGKNGPNNTFFRNRAELYGIFMNNAPASDNQNFVGNEITNNGFFLGLYQLSGTGHFQYGNNIKGTITPANTGSLSEASYYLTGRPGFISLAEIWPPIGPPNAINANSIPARHRKLSAHDYSDCNSYFPVETTVGFNEFAQAFSIRIYPNPSADILNVAGEGIMQIQLRDLAGKLLLQQIINGNGVLDLSDISQGLYVVQVFRNGEHLKTEKVIVVR